MVENSKTVRPQPRKIIGRFAPSPTGPLHFGSLLVAVGSFCLARRQHGRWLLRIDDLDTPRVVAGAAADILRTLENLGLCWDGEVVYQSQRTEAYTQSLELLQEKGMLFPCACSRKEILASAPHPGEEGPIYPGTCRSGLPHGRQARAVRLRVPQEPLCFLDGVFGEMQQCLATAVGDFVLRRADGLFAYQLAVVVDDAAAGVNQVVRGADLLMSTPRQIYLQSLLGFAVPDYIHLPLAINRQGEKISKRHGTVSLTVADGGGRLIWQALRFLGQPVPQGLQGAPAKEVLAWGCEHFAVGCVGRNPQVVEEDDFSAPDQS